MSEEITGNKIILPKDWKWVKLGEYVISLKGKKPKRISKEKTKECSIPYVNIKAFEKNIIDEYTDGVGCALCEDGDFLMVWDGSRSGYVGKAIKGALGSTLVKLDFPDIENNYAYYFLQSKFIEINTRAKGVGIPHVDPNILWNYDLLIPPRSIQQAIVSKIEELFSEIENGIKSLFAAKQQLKTYRQSVLKRAFEGKLTNENIKDGELPEGWEIKEVKSVVEKISDGPFGSNLKTADYVTSGVRIIRLENIGELEFRDEYQTFVTKEKYETIKNHTVSKGDIIFSSFISENIRTVILPDFIDKAVNKADCFLVRTLESKINRKYLVYYFSTKAMYNQLVEEIHGATRPRINTTQLKAAKIPIPSKQEQKNIVEAIESRLSVGDKMEESITESLQRAQALKQSILKKAFEGSLIMEKENGEIIKLKRVKPITKKEKAKITRLPEQGFPRKKTAITQIDLHAGIIAMVIKAHENNPRHVVKLNHVKCEKIADLVERNLGISLGRKAVKDAAGPDDYPHLKKVEYRANMAGYFSTSPLFIGHTYKPQRNLNIIITKTQQALTPEELIAVNKLIQDFLPFELEHAELVATIFAGWNNLLIEGLNPTDEEIVYESRENWSKRKLTIKRDKFFKSLSWMKEHGFIPKGKGEMVVAPKEKKVKNRIPSQCSR